MTKKENIVCDFTTGVCGPVDQNETGVIAFIDLSKKESDEKSETCEDKESK